MISEKAFLTFFYNILISISHGRDGNIIKWKMLASDAVVDEQFNVYQLGFCPVSDVNRGKCVKEVFKR